MEETVLEHYRTQLHQLVFIHDAWVAPNQSTTLTVMTSSCSGGALGVLGRDELMGSPRGLLMLSSMTRSFRVATNGARHFGQPPHKLVLRTAACQDAQHDKWKLCAQTESTQTSPVSGSSKHIGHSFNSWTAAVLLMTVSGNSCPFSSVRAAMPFIGSSIWAACVSLLAERSLYNRTNRRMPMLAAARKARMHTAMIGMT
eukprot:scaffold1941_cov377-Prasinococcus_capsulatus_cf.AAC.18